MVDPSVHPYQLDLSESDESSSGPDLRFARRNSSSSASEGDGATSTQGKVRRSRSRTRRQSVNSAVGMNGSQKKHVPKNSKPIEEHSTEQSSSSSSSSTSRSSSSSSSSSSESEALESSPKSPLNRNSCSETQSTTCSVDQSMQSSSKAIPKGKSNPDPYSYSESSSSEDDSKRSPPKETFIGTSLSATSSEDDAMQSSPKPISKGEPISDPSSGTSGPEDEPMPSPKPTPKPTSKGKSIPDTSTGTSSSEDEAMQSSPKLTSNGKSISVTKTGNSSSADEPMESTSKGKSTSQPNTGSSSSENNSPKPTFKGKSRQENELFGLEVSSTSISEDENERVLSKISDIQIDIDGETSLPKKNDESVEVQQRKLLGDKLTVKFKVTLPEIGAGLIGGPLQFLRVPHFIPVESGAFDSETFKDSMTPDDLKDEQARGDFVNRLKATVRWRENEDKTKESNTRIVRWSDGSETFHVGSEVFDVMHHKVNDDKNHLYVRLDNCYQAQGAITDKMTLRPKLDSTFGQSHVQGLRSRAMNKPQTGVVKVLSDLVANPVTDRERRAKEEIANLRREEREKRREIQMSMRKPRVKPMRHCTADDSDPEQSADEQEDLESEAPQSVFASSIESSTQGIRTNRNVAVKPGQLETTDEEEEEEGCDSDVNDIINDGDLDGDDEEMSDEPGTSSSISQKALPSCHSSKSDSDEGPKTRCVKRKTKRLIYSESDSD